MIKKPNMSDLEKEIATVENDAISEEQYNADCNYASLDKELKEVTSSIPFSRTRQYSFGRDYDDAEKLRFQKSENQPSLDKKKKLELYCNNGYLYSGHLCTKGSNYYIMEHSLAETRTIKVNGNEVWLINYDDRAYSQLTKSWRFPENDPDVSFSRSIIMGNRVVNDVDTIIDKGNELFSTITDAYLRKALIRNKDKSGVHSIIQTIQKKQDNIRSLDKDRSFIVQGCAGSGKTMVLLHRLRYLLYNKDIYNSEYVFLVPGNTFKTFINDISADFNISKDNIMPYQKYYQGLLGKKVKSDLPDVSELVFTPDYLDRVYSKSFIQDCYKDIFQLLAKQLNSLTSFSEGILVELLDVEKRSVEERIKTFESTAISQAKIVSEKIEPFTITKLVNGIEDVSELIAELESEYLNRKEAYEKAIAPEITSTISQDDERILSNESLIEVKRSIEAETIAFGKASIFTKASHRNKLEKLQSQYDSLFKQISDELIAQDKNKYAEQAAKLYYIYENVTLTEVGKIIEELNIILNDAVSIVKNAKSDLDNIDAYFGEKFAKEIDILNMLIEADILAESNDIIEFLSPAYSFLENYINSGAYLLNSFSQYIDTEEKKEVLKNDLTLFGNRTQNQNYAYFYNMLFNACKRKIDQEFGIKTSNVYKHYWYLSLYCSYLMRPMKNVDRKYIFIDEAQDLSISEIELIYKVNSMNEEPIINLFGDINQMITKHGIKDWDSLSMLSKVYTLEENFRNPNQIVEYCNKMLGMNMLKVGVDMEQVSEFDTIEKAVKSTSSIKNKAVFIVKDEYSVSDLKLMLASYPIIEDYEIYTVKTAKGLEFKEVFVFDSNMSLNEKYISYTRALVKLNVIEMLPEVTDRNSTLIVQIDEPEDDETEIRNDNGQVLKLVEYCKTMKMSYSYKPVLLLLLLDSEQFSTTIDGAVNFFKAFYKERKEKGLIVEKENCIYHDPNVSRKVIADNILANPVNALLKSGCFEYLSDTKEFRIKRDIAEHLTKDDVEIVSDICYQKLITYYSNINQI